MREKNCSVPSCVRLTGDGSCTLLVCGTVLQTTRGNWPGPNISFNTTDKGVVNTLCRRNIKNNHRQVALWARSSLSSLLEYSPLLVGTEVRSHKVGMAQTHCSPDRGLHRNWQGMFQSKFLSQQGMRTTRSELEPRFLPTCLPGLLPRVCVEPQLSCA